MPTTKAEFVEVNVYGAMGANDESAKYFYVFCFTSLPYMLQEDLE